MRCLFCGKELALLKRLRGGGEFCSEAHRKEYQDQYEQLALARLLQAKPAANSGGLPAPSPIALKPPLPHEATAKEPTPPQAEPRVPARPAVAMIEAPPPNPRPASQPAGEADPAPLAGFLGDPVIPAVTPFQHAGPLEFDRIGTPSLPVAVADPVQDESLPPAPLVEFDVSLQALDQHTRVSERAVELREFSAPPPVIDLQLQPSNETEPVGTTDAMEISMSPHPPRKASPWLPPWHAFPSAPAQLGSLARLNFPSTGFAYSDFSASAVAVDLPQAELPQAESQIEAPPEMFEAPVPSVPAQAVPAEPVTSSESAASELAPPPPVTKALPVTLHGLAAPRGKLVQPFIAIVATSDVQIPASSALPLRPMIIFGPAPAAQVPEPVLAAKATPAPASPQPQPQEKPESSFKTSMIPVPKAVPVKHPTTVPAETKPPAVSKPAAAGEPRAEKAAAARVEPPKESPVPKPLPVSDAAIPSLRLEATETAWSKLSAGAKIGIAAALIVGIAGIGYLVTRGGGKATNDVPVAAAPAGASVAAGVPISGGWIDDWADAAKSKRHISLLSGSAKLSDYRMEFQAQIETKAIGWIFRGLNPRNYYVAKLETMTPGLEPTVALVHFAVVDGLDESRVVVPLPMKSRVDTVYKVRFDAVGNHFTVWVQGQQIAEWSDKRFGSGGVGLFSDRDEKAAMQGSVNVIALVPKN